MRRGSLVGMFTPNLICELGHKSYSPTPRHWITTATTLRFCTHEHCARRSVRVRAIGGAWEYVSPLVIQPPAAVEETWQD